MSEKILGGNFEQSFMGSTAIRAGRIYIVSGQLMTFLYDCQY